MDSRRLLVFFGNILGGAATAGLVLWVLAHFKGTLTVLAIGWFLAFLLRPAVEAVARVVVLRVLAVLIVYAALAGAAALGVALAAGPVARQLAELVASLPAYAADAQRLAAYWLGLVDAGRLGVDLTVLQGELLARLQAWLAPFLTGAVSVVAGVTGFLTNLILAAVVGAYLLVDGHNIQRRLLALLPPAYRPLYLRAARQSGRVFGRYVRGQLLLALIIGSIASVGLTLLGVPYALVLGAIAGFLELLPVFGAVLGALPAIIVAAFQPLPLVFYVLAFFVVLQQLEGNVLAPRITGQAVGLHPLAALLVLVAAFEVAGLVGAMVAVPLVGGLYEFGVALWKARIGPPPGRAS